MRISFHIASGIAFLMCILSCSQVQLELNRDLRKTTDCNDKVEYRFRRDNLDYDFFYTLLRHDSKRIGSGNLSEMRSFKVSGVELHTSLDTVYARFGQPECVVSYTGVHWEKVRQLYYDGIRFTFVNYNSTDSYRLSKVMTNRSNVFTPDGFHCGMTLAQVDTLMKVVTENGTLNCDATGILSVSRGGIGPYFEFVFLNDKLITLIMDDATD